MGAIQSKEETNIIDFNKKLYIVVDLYLKSKTDTKKLNFDELKTNVSLKGHLKDILIKAFAKENCGIALSDNNLLLVSKNKKSKNSEHNQLELNAIVEITEKPKDESNALKLQKLKLRILSEFYEYTSSQYGIVISPHTTIVILYNTLSEIDVYQKSSWTRQLIS